MNALNLAPVCRTFCASKNSSKKCKHSAVYRFFCLGALWNHNTVVRDDFQILQISRNLQVLASHCCKILSDGEAPCTELMLHQSRQCTGGSCKIFAAKATRLRDSNSKRPKYCTQILSHRGAFIKNSFYTDIYTYRCFYPGMVWHTHKYLRTQVFFTQGCFYTKKAFTHRRAGTSSHRCLHTAMFFTEECLYMHVLLHRASFDTKKPLHTDVFKVNTLTQRCFYTEISSNWTNRSETH